jgi:hypothetical protein
MTEELMPSSFRYDRSRTSLATDDASVFIRNSATTKLVLRNQGTALAPEGFSIAVATS